MSKVKEITEEGGRKKGCAAEKRMKDNRREKRQMTQRGRQNRRKCCAL
jgi:uncharacterized membrane protein